MNLGSFINQMGQRTASGLNSTVLGGGGGNFPVRGVLITDTGDFFVTSDGDHIAYAQIVATDSGLLLASNGDNLTTDTGDHLSYTAFI